MDFFFYIQFIIDNKTENHNFSRALLTLRCSLGSVCWCKREIWNPCGRFLSCHSYFSLLPITVCYFILFYFMILLTASTEKFQIKKLYQNPVLDYASIYVRLQKYKSKNFHKNTQIFACNFWHSTIREQYIVLLNGRQFFLIFIQNLHLNALETLLSWA